MSGQLYAPAALSPLPIGYTERVWTEICDLAGNEPTRPAAA